MAEVERLLAISLECLHVASARFPHTHNHHIFLNVLHPVVLEPVAIEPLVLKVGHRHGSRMWKLKVRRVEVRVKVKTEDGIVPMRFFISNPSGHFFRLQVYYEDFHASSQKLVYKSALGPHKSLEGVFVDEPYPVMSPIQRRRFLARHANTTYCYDFLDLFRQALNMSWTEAGGVLADRAASHLLQVQ